MTAQDYNVFYLNSKKELKPIRLCAVQKTDDEKKFEQEKIRQKESKKQRQLSEETKFTHNYISLL